MTLPREILDRVDRVYDYHVASKHTYESVRTGPRDLDWANQPSPYRTFENFPKVPLPTNLLGIDVGTISLLYQGRDAVPESQLNPPQDLRTLATWLFLADGLTKKKQSGRHVWWLRSCPSSGALYPYEIYVAAFGVQGLLPGFYHYSPREFALYRLREGTETLAYIKRGRPDLELLRDTPAAMLVTTNFWRSAWKYQKRAYRYVLQDAGHLVENLVQAGTGLGAQVLPRLQLNDQTMRELIGVPDDADFGEMEVAQAMVIWADRANQPMPIPPGGLPPASPELMPSLVRLPLSERVTGYGSILAVHQDCTAPGVAVREIRAPATELSPLPPNVRGYDRQPIEEPYGGQPLGRVLMSRRSARDFVPRAMARDALLTINKLAFRGGSYSPVLPIGPHVGIIRPFWIINDVVGVDSGIWYYHPVNDQWYMLARHNFRPEAKFLSLEQELCGNGSAVCFMMANLHSLMTTAGPDAYRLAHLEAGIVGQRIYLASNAFGYGCSGIGAFYDDDVRKFFGLEKTGWEVIYEIVVGIPVDEEDQPRHRDESNPEQGEAQWRD